MAKKAERGGIIIKMTTAVKTRSKEVKESLSSTESLGDNLYGAGRSLARIAYTALPAGIYGATSEKLNEIDNFNWFKKLLANIFYRGDISRLNELNDCSAKGLGASAGLFAGYLIDRATEKIFPKKKETRMFLQPLGYFTLANITNLAMNGAQSLEGLVRDTMVRTGGTINNISSTGGSDSEYMANTAIAALASLAVVKGANNLLRTGLAEGTINYVKDMSREFYKLGRFLAKNTIGKAYNLTLGNANDRYESRRIKKDLKRKAERKYNKELEDIELLKGI